MVATSVSPMSGCSDSLADMRIALALTLVAFSARAEDPPAAAPAPAPVAAPAPAGPAAPSAHLAAAQRLYQKLDLDAALAELQQAELAAKDNEDETVAVLIYRGLIFSDTGKTSDATDQFKRALAMRPWAEVPPDVIEQTLINAPEARFDLNAARRARVAHWLSAGGGWQLTLKPGGLTGGGGGRARGTGAGEAPRRTVQS